MNLAALTEAALLAGVREDPAYVAELLRRYEPMLTRMAVTFAPLSYDACMQEGGMALVDAAVHYDAARGTRFATYAYVCVRNRLLRLSRRMGATADWAEVPKHASDMPTPEEEVLHWEHWEQQKLRAKAVLSPFEYAVWRMRVDGYSYAEIALTLSREGKVVSVKSVNNALVRVRRKLRGNNE